MKNRYLFLKRQYKDYLILFYKKSKVTSYGLDKKLLQFIDINCLDIMNVNYILIDEKNNMDKYDCSDNKYYELLKKYYLNNIINRIGNKLINVD